MGNTGHARALRSRAGALRTSNVRSCVFAKRKKPLRIFYTPQSTYNIKRDVSNIKIIILLSSKKTSPCALLITQQVYIKRKKYIKKKNLTNNHKNLR